MFAKENFTEKKSREKEAGDDDGNDGERKFIKGDSENAEHPKKSEPKQGTFFVYLLLEAYIQIVPQQSERERK